VARGLVPKQTVLNKYGCSTNVDSGIVTDIWDPANATDDLDNLEYLTTADLMVVQSTNAVDDDTGTGMQTMRIIGLDASWNEISEDVALQTAGVTTTKSFIRVYRAYGLTYGSGGVNAGDISIIDDGGVAATPQAQINTGKGQTLMALYTVPATHTLILTHYYASILKSSAGAADIQLLSRLDADTATAGWRVRHYNAVHSTGGTYTRHDLMGGLKLPPKTDVRMTANGSAPNLTVMGGFGGILIEN